MTATKTRHEMVRIIGNGAAFYAEVPTDNGTELTVQLNLDDLFVADE